jgi:putative intracellular protease/amidase
MLYYHLQVNLFSHEINSKKIFLENELSKRGATYGKTYVHEPLVIVSGNGRLITGQNPESATNGGEKVVEILKGDKQHPWDPTK